MTRGVGSGVELGGWGCTSQNLEGKIDGTYGEAKIEYKDRNTKAKAMGK